MQEENSSTNAEHGKAGLLVAQRNAVQLLSVSTSLMGLISDGGWGNGGMGGGGFPCS